MGAAHTILHFTGRSRAAAMMLLGDTPLGLLIEYVDDPARAPDPAFSGRGVDDGQVLTIDVPDDHLNSWSTGERHLWLFLGSLCGSNPVNLLSTVFAIDADCQRAAHRAFGILAGAEA